MDRNNQIKKIGLIVLLLVIVGIVAYVVIAKPSVEKRDNTTKTFTQVKDDEEEITANDEENAQEGNKNDEENVQEGNTTENLEQVTDDEGEAIEITANNEEASVQKGNKQGKEVIVTKLKTGTLYSISGESIKPQIIIGDNYYDTQLSDVNTNFSTYEGKTVEIEGFYMEDSPYTFVGRYSESNLCAYCPQGYSYFEFEWHGNNKFDFTNETEWLKIIGTYRKGVDELGEYYYIDASSIQVMKERGQDTVKN